LKYLQANLNRTEDSYTLALTAYAMELANYPLKEIVLSKLLAKSVRTGNTICNVKSRMLSDLQLLLT
jgi:hypothetical protein